MKEIDARLHQKLETHQRRVAQAQDIIAKSLEVCGNPYVACSFGKDSSAMLHLVLCYAPSIEVRFLRWTESQMLDDFDRVIEWWLNRGINLHIIDMHRDSIDEKAGDRWQKVEEFSPCDGYFIGLRADESRGRRITLSKDGEIYVRKDGMVRLAPLAWWRTIDVAAYTLAHDLPMLDAYNAGGFEQRTSARVPRESVRPNALSELKRRDIGRFNALVSKYPEARAYV